MSVDACVHWSTRALQEGGYSTSVEGDTVIWGEKDPHVAMVFCHAAPTITIVIATNGSSADATRERDEFQRRIHEIARHREHWR